jgi:uncharacterized protein
VKKEVFNMLEAHMLSCMKDSAHDKEHIYRVLYEALDIAQTQQDVDYDVLIAACMLHDIGRQEQFEDPALCHARVGAKKAYHFLVDQGFSKDFADKVSACILTHRYRKDNFPRSIEAKILFDADKVDVTGAVGIARTLVYNGQVSEPLYSTGPEGEILDGTDDTCPSFFQEYKYKLEKLYSGFLTERGAEIAKQRQEAAVAFYESILREVKGSCQKGLDYLDRYVDE